MLKKNKYFISELFQVGFMLQIKKKNLGKNYFITIAQNAY